MVPRPFGSPAKSPLLNLCRTPSPRSQALPHHPHHQACRGRASPPGAPRLLVMSGGRRAGGCWVPGAVWQLKAIKVVCTALQAKGNAAMNKKSVWPKGGRETEQGPRRAGRQGETQSGGDGAARAAGLGRGSQDRGRVVGTGWGLHLPAVLGWPGARPRAQGSWPWLGASGAGAESPEDWRGQPSGYRRFRAEQNNRVERSRARGRCPPLRFAAAPQVPSHSVKPGVTSGG